MSKLSIKQLINFSASNVAKGAKIILDTLKNMKDTSRSLHKLSEFYYKFDKTEPEVLDDFYAHLLQIQARSKKPPIKKGNVSIYKNSGVSTKDGFIEGTIIDEYEPEIRHTETDFEFTKENWIKLLNSLIK